MLDTCSVGDLCIDFIVTGNVVPRFKQIEQLVDDYVFELGGSATIFASQFVKLGGSSGLVGKVGDDAFGQYIFNKIKAIGIDTSRIDIQKEIKTGFSIALTKPDDRAILTYLGTIDAIDPSELGDDLLTTFRHWHLTLYFLLTRLKEYWPVWLRKCRVAGITTSLDPNWDPDDRWEGIWDLLPYVDIFLPNEAEALSITGESEIQRAGKKLSEHTPLAVIKLGGKGAMAFQGSNTWSAKPNEVYEAPAVIVDAIGAGDNFDAGFINSWQDGQDIESCLKLGCQCGAASLAGPGGFESQLQLGSKYPC